MSLTLIPQQPPVPSQQWLREFARVMTELQPGLGADTALRSGLLACARSKRASDAMLSMVKIDIAALEAAQAGRTQAHGRL